MRMISDNAKCQKLIILPEPGCVLDAWIPLQDPSLANSRHKAAQLHLGQASSYYKSCETAANNQSGPPMQPRGP